MFRNYFKIAWRKLRKNKLYSLVNIIGLTAALASCLLIGIYLRNEITYDSFHVNADRIVRVTMEYAHDGDARKAAVTGTKAGPQFKRVFPEVEEYVRTYKDNRVVSYQSNIFNENVLYADNAFFKVFTFNTIKGNPADVLSDPDKVVLTEKSKKKYLGNDEAIGKTLKVGDKVFIVSGITADPPSNSQIKFDFVLPFSALNASKKEEWFTANYVTYLLLKHPSDINPLQKYITSYMKVISRNELSMTGKSYLTEHLEPLKKVHLHSDLSGFEPNGNITYIYVLLTVALLTLFIAAVNYTNLAVAQSTERGVEVSIRKVLGASRGQLFKQFIGESFLFTILSLALSIVLALILLPQFNLITGINFKIKDLLSPVVLVSLLLLSVLIGFVAGAYPSLLLTKIKLIKLLKLEFSFSSNNIVRQSLIVFQFIVSFFLIVSTIVIVKQLNFIQTRNVGYARSNIIALPVDYRSYPIVNSLKVQIEALNGVQGVSVANSSPVDVGWGDAVSTSDGKKIMVNAIPVDENFIPLFKIKMLSGSNYTHADVLQIDTTDQDKHLQYSFIINETAAKALGWSAEQAIGKKLNRNNDGIIKGVVKDFNFKSMHEPLTPLIMFLDNENTNNIFVKVNGHNNPEVLANLQRIWKQYVTYKPFEYSFIDDDFNAIYKAEKRTSLVFQYFSALAILLACLGLFALTAYAVITRTKEIGIRKVLGASVTNITLLLSKNFIKLVLVAIIIASPVAWFIMNIWLRDFAYRIHLQFYIFAIAAVVTITIAFVTVSFQSVKAAITTPIKSLRNN